MRSKAKANRTQAGKGKEVSAMPTTTQVIAVLCSDLHLSHKPPIARSAEPDWYAAQKRVLHELHGISEEHQCPIIFAGDLFDRWNPPPELINFALDNLPPDMYCIPGNHDLPLHAYNEIEKSAYYTMVTAGKINDIDPHRPTYIRRHNLMLHAFPCGFEVHPLPDDIKPPGYFHLAVVHAYLWVNKHNSYPGASEDAQLQKWFRKLAGYDTAVFGDNHIQCEGEGHSVRTIWNCGGLLRRKIDEVGYTPTVGLLHSNGTVKPHYLDTSEDKFIDAEKLPGGKVQIDLEAFITELGNLGAAGLDFDTALMRHCNDNNVPPEIKTVLLQALEGE